MAEKSITASIKDGKLVIVDNETGKNVSYENKECKNKKGETVKYVKIADNSANRNLLTIARVEEAEGKTLTLGYKPTVTIGVASADKANLIPAKFIAYLTPEEKTWYDALVKKVVDAYNAANPVGEKKAGTSAKAEMEAALAKKFGITVEELRKIVEEEKAAKSKKEAK